jgi:hypothetical protein
MQQALRLNVLGNDYWQRKQKQMLVNSAAIIEKLIT